MEELCDGAFVEVKSHQYFSINLLNALVTVQDKAFLCTLEKTQDSSKSGEAIVNESITHQGTAKYLKLICLNQCKFLQEGMATYLQMEDIKIASARKHVNPLLRGRLNLY